MCTLHPNDKIIDIEEVNRKLDKHISTPYLKPSDEDIIKFKPMIDELLEGTSLMILKRKYSYSHKYSFLYYIFLKYYISNQCGYTLSDHNKLRSILKINHCKSDSGILSVTIFTSPYPVFTDDNGNSVKQSFSCEWNCSYCPNEPGQPRSYLKGEPGVLRANREKFDAVRQMYIRMEALFLTGHDIDKLEVLILGGTWTSYPLLYREEFIRDMYYSANTFKNHIINIIDSKNIQNIRNRTSMSEEIYKNINNDTKVIGLTLETRPDTINKDELIRFRSYGCTRLQLGVQHIDDYILNKINRKCKRLLLVS